MPEHPAVIAGWERDAALYREARRQRCEIGVPYGPHPRQTVDLFLPDDVDPTRPLIVLIHGGYWRTFAPSLFSHWAAGANAHGYAVALPGYRLCPEVSVGTIIADMRAAILHLHRRVAAPLVVAGHSAGGHLAACAVATDWRAEAADVPAGIVRHGLAISGLFDLAPLLATTLNKDLRLDAGSAARASPAFWRVPENAIFEAFVGAEESSEYLRQSRLIAERWSAAGAKTRFEVVRAANHFTAPASLGAPDGVLTTALVRLARSATR